MHCHTFSTRSWILRVNHSEICLRTLTRRFTSIISLWLRCCLISRIKSNFINEDLVYYFDSVDTWQQLCVSKTLEKKIFKMMHDDHYHADFHQVYNSIVADLYIWNLSQHLKQYITHCLKCLHYQTVRHVSYRAL